MSKTYLVLHTEKGRQGSVELTDRNRDHFRALFCCSLLQVDASGTEHWLLLYPWGDCAQGEWLRAEFRMKYGEKLHA